MEFLVEFEPHVPDETLATEVDPRRRAQRGVSVG
jgi:hypothetical protein